MSRDDFIVNYSNNIDKLDKHFYSNDHYDTENNFINIIYDEHIAYDDFFYKYIRNNHVVIYYNRFHHYYKYDVPCSWYYHDNIGCPCRYYDDNEPALD